MDGTTTMKPRVLVAAAAFLALAGAIAPMDARLLAAEGAAAPAAVPVIAVAEDLPSFEPSPEAIEAVSIPVVQSLPQEAEPDEPEVDADGRAIGSGVASWYGREFAGRKTANGERFDPSGYTAAHRTLPFGSKVRVTRGGKSVIVRINDRG